LFAIRVGKIGNTRGEPNSSQEGGKLEVREKVNNG
jgi:hypothetical protein